MVFLLQALGLGCQFNVSLAGAQQRPVVRHGHLAALLVPLLLHLGAPGLGSRAVQRPTGSGQGQGHHHQGSGSAQHHAPKHLACSCTRRWVSPGNALP